MAGAAAEPEKRVPSDPQRGWDPAEPQAILLAESDPGLQRLHWLSLHRLGLRVHPKRTGREALEHLRTNRLLAVAVIALDLPGLDGCTLASAFRLEAPDSEVRLVAIAGEDSLRARQWALYAGFDVFLPGRCEGGVLSETVSSLVARPLSVDRAPDCEDDVQRWLEKLGPAELLRRAARFWVDAEDELAAFRAAVVLRSRYDAAMAARSLARLCRKVGLTRASALAEQARRLALIEPAELEETPGRLARELREGYSRLLSLSRK